MIDPSKVPFYDLNDYQLEEFLCFCILVAGKKASYIAEKWDTMLRYMHLQANYPTNATPFSLIRSYDFNALRKIIKMFGIGCYGLKASGLLFVSESGIDLRTCTTDDLEKSPAIGPKTSRFFILHTRRDARVACLDTHLLKWLHAKGYPVPKATPAGGMYKHVEQIFLGIADQLQMNPADLDIQIWNHYANGEILKV